MNTKYWPEYKKWVEEENKPMLDFWLKDMKRRNEDYEKRKKQYEVELAAWRKRKQEYDRIRKGRSWLEKLTMEDGVPHWYTFGRPVSPLIDIGYMYIPKHRVTIEGYLDWCEKNNKL